MEPRSLVQFRLTDKIGSGAMGEVWRALDTTLEREVAIKILPDAFARDTGRLARFEHEAKLLASLRSHQNIAATHGLEQAGDVRFLVLELVEGETLEELLRRRRLPLDDALDIAKQIALDIG